MAVIFTEHLYIFRNNHISFLSPAEKFRFNALTSGDYHLN